MSFPSLDQVEQGMGAAVAAATAAFAEAGVPATAIVVNAAWVDGQDEFVAGSRVPDDAPAVLAESLRASAEEVDDRG